MSLHNFIIWLQGTELSQTIQVIPWIIPLTQSIHIVAIAAVIGSMGLLDLRVLGLAARGQSLISMRRRLLPWMWRALIVLAVTGSILVIGEPGRSLANPIFQAKMLLILTAIVVTLFFTRSLRATDSLGNRAKASTTAKFAALVSLLLWILIVFAGRWIAYGDAFFTLPSS